MKVSQIFNGIFFVSLLALIVVVVQSQTGFFISPEIQVGILAGVSLVVRAFTGRDLFAGKIPVPVGERPEVPKIFWTTKTFWVSVLATIAIPAKQIFGIDITPEMHLYLFSVVQFALSIVTHKPVVLR